MGRLTTEQMIKNLKLYEERSLPKGKCFPSMQVKKMETGLIVRFRKLTGLTEPVFVPDFKENINGKTVLERS